MNNKPVAWMNDYGTPSSFKTDAYNIPLYTHPSKHDLGIAEAIGFDKGHAAAQAKTLTDEEVNKILESFNFPTEYVNPYDFAKAILRKAQEK